MIDLFSDSCKQPSLLLSPYQNSTGTHSFHTKSPPAPSISTIDGGAKAQLPRHLSPLWNKKHDVSIFGRHICWISLSDAAGHMSFVFLGMGFLETDLLPLRLYAAAGSTVYDVRKHTPVIKFWSLNIQITWCGVLSGGWAWITIGSRSESYFTC